MSSKIQKVQLGDFRFDVISLSPQEVKDRIVPADFNHEIPLKKGPKGIVASREIPFSGETQVTFITNVRDTAPAGAKPRMPAFKVHHSGETKTAYFMMRKQTLTGSRGIVRQIFSISIGTSGLDQMTLDLGKGRVMDYAQYQAGMGLMVGAKFTGSIRSVSLGDFNDDGRTDILVSLKRGGAYLFQQSPVLTSMLCTPNVCTVL